MCDFKQSPARLITENRILPDPAAGFHNSGIHGKVDMTDDGIPAKQNKLLTEIKRDRLREVQDKLWKDFEISLYRNYFDEASSDEEKQKVVIEFVENYPEALKHSPWAISFLGRDQSQQKTIEQFRQVIKDCLSENPLARIAEAESVEKEVSVTKTRAEIVRRHIATATDFIDTEKVKALCIELNNAKIPIPTRKTRISSGKAGLRGYEVETHTWKEISNSPKTALYKWLFNRRRSPLLTDIYRRKKKNR